MERERKEEEPRIAVEKRKKKAKKVFAIGTPIVCACFAFVLVLITVIIPKQKMNKNIENLNTANVGDTIFFGTYEQDNNIFNGKEDVEWLVLAKEDNKILVVSDKTLDCRKYNSSKTSVTWETCTLRKWLNGTFLNKAFSIAERAQIQNTTVSADNNPPYSTNPGNATTDKVFLLSINEVEKHFNSEEARKCTPTAYAKAQGASTSDTYKTPSGAATCWWWLRSPGISQYGAAGVFSDGDVFENGYFVDIGVSAVRPAMWITIDG